MDEKNVNAKNTKGLIIGGAVLATLLLITVLAYILIPTKPSKVFNRAIEKVYSLSKEKQQDDKSSGKFTISTDIHSNKVEEEKVLEIINNINISMDFGVDTNSKKMHIALDSKYKEKDLLKASMDIKENNAYVFLEDIYSKYLSVPVEGIEDMFQVIEQTKDYEILLKQVKNALNKALKDEYFEKKNETITINNKSVKVTDNRLILNEKNVKEIAIVLSNELNNDEFIDHYASLTDSSKEEIKEMVENLKDEEIDLEDGTLTVSIYTKGLQNKFAGIAFKDGSDTISFIKNTETNYAYEIKVDHKVYKGNIEVEMKDKDLKMKVFFDIEGINGSISVSYANNKEINFPEIDTSKVIKTEDLSQKEALEIIEKLQNNEGILELMQALSSINSLGLNF